MAGKPHGWQTTWLANHMAGKPHGWQTTWLTNHTAGKPHGWQTSNLMAFVGQGKHGRKSDLQVMVHFRSKIWLTVFVFLNFGPT